MERMIKGWLIICLILIAYGDGKNRSIPDWLTAGVAAPGILLGFLYPEPGWGFRLMGAASVSGILILLCLLRPGCFGGGDVKLAAACGLVLGPGKNLEAFAIAVLAAGIYAGGFLAAGRLRRDSQIPFGPFLCLGAAAEMFWL